MLPIRTITTTAGSSLKIQIEFHAFHRVEKLEMHGDSRIPIFEEQILEQEINSSTLNPMGISLVSRGTWHTWTWKIRHIFSYDARWISNRCFWGGRGRIRAIWRLKSAFSGVRSLNVLVAQCNTIPLSLSPLAPRSDIEEQPWSVFNAKPSGVLVLFCRE